MLAGMSAAAIKCSGNSAGRVEFHLSAHPPNQGVLFFFFFDKSTTVKCKHTAKALRLFKNML